MRGVQADFQEFISIFVAMKKRMGIGLVLLLLFAGCKKEPEVLCGTDPATASLRFRLLNDTTSGDLYLPGQRYALLKDSMEARQPCYNNPLVPRFTTYQQPGGVTAVSFEFVNLPNPAVNEADSCFTILVKWDKNKADVDTIQWRYHVERIENCDLQILDYVLFNGNGTQKYYDGVFEYYALRK